MIKSTVWSCLCALTEYSVAELYPQLFLTIHEWTDTIGPDGQLLWLWLKDLKCTPTPGKPMSFTGLKWMAGEGILSGNVSVGS